MIRSLRRVALAVALLGSSIFGCAAKPPPEYPVRGTVSFDGKPLPNGEVYFKTVETGVLEHFDVKNGEFAGKAQQGERRVEVYAFKSRTGNFSGMKGEVQENLIPARYNLESKLNATVTPAGPNEYAFELKGK